MILKQNELKIETREKMRGGEGTIEFLHYYDESKINNCRLLAQITIPVGASIGEHSHTNEIEFYIIHSGVAMVCDDGVDKEVASGDVVITTGGASHNIRNIGNEPVVMSAVIITEEK